MSTNTTMPGTKEYDLEDPAKPIPNPSGGSPKLLKYFSLLSLTVQNALLILVMRYVRTRDVDMFMATTAVILIELLKVIACVVIIFAQEGNIQSFFQRIKEDIISQPLDCLKVSVPSLIYVLQNNLLYVAISNLDAATYQVTYQLKILTTAIFSVFMLKKQLSKIQWVALCILFVGVSIVQMQPTSDQKSTTVATTQSRLKGLVAVCISCIMSGFAGVYFEKILKGTPQSVWIRNIQLGVLGCFIGIITMFLKDGSSVHAKGFFFGYDAVVVFVICLQSFGGLIVAVVVKYADNILKGFATSAAIVISCLASIFLFSFELSVQFSVGSVLVMVAVYIYNKYVPVLSKPEKPI